MAAKAKETAEKVLAQIGEPVPAEMIRTKQKGGTNIAFISWTDACSLMDQRAPGWSNEIKAIQHVGGLVVLTVAVTVPTDDGPITREATGNEQDVVDTYGDPFSNAESMALRRAFAKFGLARELYGGQDSRPATRAKAKSKAKATPKANGGVRAALEKAGGDVDAILALLPKIDAIEGAERRFAGLKLWTAAVIERGAQTDVMTAMETITEWDKSKPGRGYVLGELDKAL